MAKTCSKMFTGAVKAGRGFGQNSFGFWAFQFCFKVNLEFVFSELLGYSNFAGLAC